MNEDFWGERYKKEGFIWGQNPSLTAQFVLATLPSPASIFEIGFGYGRDLIHLTKIGYQVEGIENSPVALQITQNQLKANNLLVNGLVHGDFTQVSLPLGNYDLVYSHRTLHLIQEENAINRFADQANHILKPNGWLLISARDDRGTHPKRKGHQVSFWNKERFEKVFSENFEIVQFIEGTEIESFSNPKATFFTLMIARRKFQTGACIAPV